MEITWGSYTAVLKATPKLTPGIDADTFTVEIYDDPSGIPADADLTIDDGLGGSVTFSNCRIKEDSFQADTENFRATFIARDRRCRWGKKDPISGEYNRRDAAGNITGTEKTAPELASLLLSALGESADTSALPGSAKPHVNWEYASPAEKLRDLCNRYGVVICLGADDTVRLWNIGEGETLPTADIAAHDRRTTRSDKPGKVILVGGKNRYQITHDIYAVGYEPSDREYHSMLGSDISWKPLGGWYPNFEDDIADADNYDAARRTAWRAYRLPATITLGDDEVDRVESVRYWAERIVEKEAPDGIERYRKPYAYGQHATERVFDDPIAFVTTSDAEVPVDFDLDRETGIIFFDEPVFDIDTDGNVVKSPVLYLVAAWDYGKYTKEQSVAGGVEGFTDTIFHDDVRYEYIDGELQNETATDQAAAQYIADHIAQYSDITATGSVYSGFKAYSPDGIIEEVSWSGSTTSDPETTVALGGTIRSKPRRVRELEIDTAILARDSRRERM